MRIRINHIPEFKKGGELPYRNNLHQSVKYDSDKDITPDSKVNTTIKKVSRKNSNLEAEKGETVVTNMSDKSGIPELYNIGGKKHSQGGTPLNVPVGSFFFSDTPALKIKDKRVLKMFGSKDGKSRTPAELSKKYDLNKYRKILADPYASKMEKHTAELMIKNYSEKLGKLALVQESMKGFVDGIPDIAEPYVVNSRVDLNKVFTSQFNKDNEMEQLTNNSVENNELEEGVEPNDYASEFARYGGQKNKIKIKIMSAPKFTPAGEAKEPELGDATNSYTRFLELMKNDELKKELVKRMRDKISSIKPNKQLTQKDIDTIKNMSDDDLLRTYIYGTKRVFAFNNANVITKDWDKNPNAHNEAAKKFGLKEYNPAQVGAFQLGYQAIAEMANDDKFKDVLKDFDLATTGPKHDGYTGKKDNISPVDGYWGDNTANQGVMLKANGPEQNPKDASWKDLSHLGNKKKEDRAEWMTNDMINLLGALNDRDKLKQYQPWSSPINIKGISPTYTDFRTQAARLNSASTSAVNAQSQFAGPQLTAAIANDAAANLADQMGNVTSAENTTNVNIANNFALQNAQRNDAANASNAQRKTNDYNNWVAMKNDFDTERLKYRQNLRNMLTTAIDNRSKLQMLNSLNDNYKVDRNGIMHFVNDGKLKGTTPTDTKQDLMNDIAWAKKHFGNDWKDALEMFYNRGDEKYMRKNEKKSYDDEEKQKYADAYAALYSNNGIQ